MNIINPFRFQTEVITPTSFLVSEYPLTETTGNAIDIVGGINGTLFGSPVRDGVKYTFDGVDDNIEIPDDTSHTFIDANGDIPFAVECKIKFDTISGYKWIICKRYFNEVEWQLFVYNSKLYFNLVDKNGVAMTRAITIPAINVEYKIKVTYDGSNTRNGMQIYIDDVVGSTYTDSDNATYAGMKNTLGKVIIGRIGNNQTYFLKGTLRDVKIYKGGTS